MGHGSGWEVVLLPDSTPPNSLAPELSNSSTVPISRVP